MLSGAKHLQYLVQNNQMQILRFAQDDRPGVFPRSLLIHKPYRKWNSVASHGNIRLHQGVRSNFAIRP